MTAIQHTYNDLIHRTLRSLAVIVAVCLAIVLPGACSSSDPDAMPVPVPPSDGEAGALQTGFTLTVSAPGQPSASRATPTDGPYDPGAGYENYIDITNGDFRFYFFNADDSTYLGQLKVNSLLTTSQTATSKTYYVMGEVPHDIRGRKLKIVALANWRQQYGFEDTLVAGTSTIDDLCHVTYDFSPSSMLLSETNTIPLFGISRPETLSFDVDNFARLTNTIHLLRACAKVEVLLNETSGAAIEWVRLHRYNKSGYCAPHGVYNEEDYVKNSYASDYTQKPSIPWNSEIDDDLSFMPDGDGRWVIYIPEYRNLEDTGMPRPEDERTYINVKFESDNAPVKLHMALYDTNKYPNVPKTHLDVMRNVWYRFNVKKVFPDLEVDVVPYGVVDLKPSFGLDINQRLPESLYVVGCIEDETEFVIDRGYELHQIPGNEYLYQGEVKLMGAFYLVEKLSNGKGSVTMEYTQQGTSYEYTVTDNPSPDDPFFNADNRYSPKTSNQRISTNIAVIFQEMAKPNPINLTSAAAKATYLMTVDFENMEIILDTPPSAGQQTQ